MFNLRIVKIQIKNLYKVITKTKGKGKGNGKSLNKTATWHSSV